MRGPTTKTYHFKLIYMLRRSCCPPCLRPLAVCNSARCCAQPPCNESCQMRKRDLEINSELDKARQPNPQRLKIGLIQSVALRWPRDLLKGRSVGSLQVQCLSDGDKQSRAWNGIVRTYHISGKKINVICVYIVKTQLYLLALYWVSTTLGTTTCFGH